MKIGTRSVLFGVHQFVLHPVLVLVAWLIIYRSFPRFHELCAIATHDLGYWGQPNMDGDEGERHPEVASAWWRGKFGEFGNKVADEIIGHSRSHAEKAGIEVSRLFRPDKLATALYPKVLYLLLANLSGEIKEYMGLCENGGKYDNLNKATGNQWEWLIDTQAHMGLIGLHGKRYLPEDVPPITFIDLCLSGKAKLSEVDDYIELWHHTDSSYSLHEYLGMSWEEFKEFGTTPSVLTDIIEERKARS